MVDRYPVYPLKTLADISSPLLTRIAEQNENVLQVGTKGLLKVLNMNTQGQPIMLLMIKIDFDIMIFKIFDVGIKVVNTDIDIVNKYMILRGMIGDLIKRCELFIIIFIDYHSCSGEETETYAI